MPQTNNHGELTTQRVELDSIFCAFHSNSIENVILEMTNLQRRSCSPETWKLFNVTDLRAYIDLLILGRVYTFRDKATEVCGTLKKRAIFPAAMSLKKFHQISRIKQFNNHSSRASKDKLAAMRVIWDTWVKNLPKMYNPSENVTIDERLYPFKG
ncbi:hypothetical protein T4B_13951 [Trichinella pseudospiralis]|uniref:PiggyBac transposable element-derived protein domain-containing protein n=1 Tax=Trichinella pseudospiralis TaxID=6337 RepID=A0A0V1J1C9_TRIPS|nr:hypothetical protein T4A_3292 [Trichinella pseudospiralis]KRZ28767.1 hypothetical protein T4B_13080 [Trichinella pseudospiralis]KRZ28778.1 hypothetical protein T4B_13951 [Trichinella pseudospiralis]KRZ30540.1 hypothetical protein T4C_7349 [Trichinella pseudospiralis]